MELDKERYARLVKRTCPRSPLLTDCLWAFFVGGGICALGEGVRTAWLAAGHTLSDAGALTSVTLIAASGLLTGLGWYQKLAAKAGAGTLVPITGFANAMVSPALEFKNEGFILGIAAKMFVIAGPVLVYGLTASVVYGVLLCLGQLVV